VQGRISAILKPRVLNVIVDYAISRSELQSQCLAALGCLADKCPCFKDDSHRLKYARR
jgi:hypothetical protein